MSEMTLCREVDYRSLISTKNIIGMVIHERRCDISAIPEATVGSLPYALGITMVLSPSGIESEHTAHIMKSSERGSEVNTAINTTGITIRRMIDTAYMLTFVNTFLKLMLATVIPVSNIATGDIQSPNVVITFETPL